MEKTLTIPEVAAVLRLSHDVVRALCKRGLGYKVAGEWRIPPERCEAFRLHGPESLPQTEPPPVKRRATRKDIQLARLRYGD